MQSCFIPWIRDLEVMVWWKNRGSKISWHWPCKPIDVEKKGLNSSLNIKIPYSWNREFVLSTLPVQERPDLPGMMRNCYYFKTLSCIVGIPSLYLNKSLSLEKLVILFFIDRKLSKIEAWCYPKGMSLQNKKFKNQKFKILKSDFYSLCAVIKSRTLRFGERPRYRSET
jgi:hypothetical protein